MFAWIVKLASAFRRLRLWKRVTLVALLAVIVPYLALWLSFWVGPGRWLWNYSISWHPALRHVVPPGPWDPLKGEPIWIEQIYESPHMSTWDIPELSSPTYHVDQPHSAHIPAYSSPSLLKLHIFSTIRNVSRPKRDVIRRLSPIYTIPVHLRHLVEVKFVIGKPKLPDGTIDMEKQKEFDQEQEEFGDLFQLDLKKGENLREGKILDWIRAVGDGEDGGRDSLWLFKMDDDVSPALSPFVYGRLRENVHLDLLRLESSFSRKSMSLPQADDELTLTQTILNMPKFLDVLVSLDARIPHYLGTSLNRWPPYHHHFTGLLTGFSWGVVSHRRPYSGKKHRLTLLGENVGNWNRQIIAPVD